MRQLPGQLVVSFQRKSTGGSTSFVFSAMSLQTSGSEDMQMVWTSKHCAKAVFIANRATEHQLQLHRDGFFKKLKDKQAKILKGGLSKIFYS